MQIEMMCDVVLNDKFYMIYQCKKNAEALDWTSVIIVEKKFFYQKLIQLIHTYIQRHAMLHVY